MASYFFQLFQPFKAIAVVGQSHETGGNNRPKKGWVVVGKKEKRKLTFRLTAGGRLSKSTASIVGICDRIFRLVLVVAETPAVQQDTRLIAGRRDSEEFE